LYFRNRELDELRAIKRRNDVCDKACGVGLWDANLFNADAMHAQSRWRWSSEFRRLIGYETEAEFPNVVQSWSDRLHPDDVERTFAAFAASLKDVSGRSSYIVEYRLKIRDGSYRWFRATGGCALDEKGRVHACGSLVDIQDLKEAEAAANQMIEALSNALARLAKGDLTAAIEAELSGRYSQIKSDFNGAVGQMRRAVAEVASTAQSIHARVAEISSATTDLSRRTEQQAASLEETAAAVNQITATVKATAEGALDSTRATQSAKGDAERSGTVVTEAVTAMGEIEGSARQISQIIGVIDEIAFQTNLLALNAGVEAARAGEAGRGFAVVASEVRALAQRSAEAAKQIKTLITTSTDQVAKGVGLVGSTGEMLQSIITQVSEAAALVAEISASAQEQAASLAQVNNAMGQMDHVTQQNAAMVEEASAASHALASEAEALAALVARFVVGEPEVRRSASPASPAARRAA